MERYSELSKRYLKYQKGRSVLTILGVALAAGALFVFLTLYFSSFYNSREKLRKEFNYDMVFNITDEEAVQEIISQDYVKSAYLGTYYDESTNTNYFHALFINLKNPYTMDKRLTEISDKYGVEGHLNEDLAGYYMQGDDGDYNYIVLLLMLLLSVIFAIIGVGIVRNSIQLNTIEQVKDYGILRCIGSTAGQLKKIIFLVGFYQEIAGIALGFLLGYPLAAAIGYLAKIKVRPHIIPFAFVLIAFLGDLYFVMVENSKLVKKLTPVEAVRGNFSVKKKKIRRRGKNLFGLIFGLDGDYAYKNLKANKGRYYKSVFAFGLGIAFFIGIAVYANSLKAIDKAFSRRFGDYPIYFYSAYSDAWDMDRVQASLPSYSVLQHLAEDENVDDVRTMYHAYLDVLDPAAYFAKFSQEYREESALGGMYLDSAKDYSTMLSKIELSGYEPEEYEKLSDLLVEGTLNVSENGIVIARDVITIPMEEYEAEVPSLEGMFGDWFQCSDYHVGDKVSFYDINTVQKLYKDNLAQTNFEELAAEIDEMQLEMERTEDYSNERYRELVEQANHIDDDCLERAHKTAYEMGAYKEYTVEGVVAHNLDTYTDSMVMQAIVPLEQFYNITGMERGKGTGVKYSLKKNKLTKYMENTLMDSMMLYGCQQSDYVFSIESIQSAIKQMRYISLFIIFVVIMCSVNVINTSASNLHLRRQELAQLRVVGVSNRRLCKMVMLEGVITVISANILGNALGYGAIHLAKKAVNVLFKIPLVGTATASIAGLVVSSLILCGSIYFPIKKMGKDILANLNASGD